MRKNALKAFGRIRRRLLIEVKLHKATCVNRLYKSFRSIASVRQNALKAFGRIRCNCPFFHPQPRPPPLPPCAAHWKQWFCHTACQHFKPSLPWRCQTTRYIWMLPSIHTASPHSRLLPLQSPHFLPHCMTALQNAVIEQATDCAKATHACCHYYHSIITWCRDKAGSRHARPAVKSYIGMLP